MKELLTALRNAAKAHQSLFEKTRSLYRDISKNNIIITNPKTTNGFRDMLINLDLVIVNSKQTDRRHMISTMEFIVVDVLCGVKHTYQYNLELFFYILLWIYARRA